MARADRRQARNSGTRLASIKAVIVTIHMTERERQTAFMESLLKEGSGESGRLRERLTKAQHDERCIRRALILMLIVGAFALLGLGYSAVLLPEFFDNATPFLVKIFCALGLGSLMCMIIFGGCWLWYRTVSNQVNEDCRHFIEHYVRSVGETTFIRTRSPNVARSTAQVYQIETPEEFEPEARIIQFPQAS